MVPLKSEEVTYYTKNFMNSFDKTQNLVFLRTRAPTHLTKYRTRTLGKATIKNNRENKSIILEEFNIEKQLYGTCFPARVRHKILVKV